jgi:hypothetical protein
MMSMSMSIVVLAVLLLATPVDAFVRLAHQRTPLCTSPLPARLTTAAPPMGQPPQPPILLLRPSMTRTVRLYSEPNDTNDRLSQQEKLSRLGFTSEELQTTKQKQIEPIKVQVNEIGNIDAATLTAVGFGLIAFNFFVLANLGDGGIAGTVATILNMLKE